MFVFTLDCHTLYSCNLIHEYENAAFLICYRPAWVLDARRPIKDFLKHVQTEVCVHFQLTCDATGNIIRCLSLI